jgi:soluble lytic murein transglycosylase
MNTSVKQNLVLELSRATRLARVVGKYIFFFAVFYQGVIGVEEMISLKHISNETQYGPVESHVMAAPSSQTLSEETLIRYNFTDANSFYRSLNTSFISAVDKQLLHESVLNTIPRPLRVNAQKYIDDIFHFSEKNRLDPVWVMAIIWTESHFKPRASSHVSATGLMQIMPNTGTFLSRLLKRPNDKKLVMQLLVDPRSNIELGTFYLRRLLNRFKTHRYATVAYNMGPRFVSRRLKTGQPIGTKNHYYNKVKRYYRILLSGVHKLEQSSYSEGKKSILKYQPKLKPLKYYLGYDLRIIISPKFAKR